MATNLADVLKSIEKMSGKKALMQGVEVKDVERIPLPMVTVNRMLYGGIPKGRMIEFAGAESGGKTSTALLLAGAYQKQDDRPVFFVDSEGTYDPRWAAKLGVDNDRLIKWAPENVTAEEVFQKILEVAETNEVGLIILDSIPALVPQQIDAKDMTEYQMGGISKALTTFTMKLQKVLLANDTITFIGLNQIRDRMSSYGSPTKTPGGRAWKHLTSVRLEMSSSAVDKNGNYVPESNENPAGVMIAVNVRKNKTAPRNRKLGRYIIDFDEGFNEVLDVVNVAVSLGIITQRGASFSYTDTETGEVIAKGMGKAKFIESLTEEIFLEIKEKVNNYDD